MLAIKTTEKLTGVTVSGTYGELNALYDALSNVTGEEESYPELEACRIRVLGLCYDIRHAYQGDRNRGKNEYGEEIFSFEYLWPEMVFIFAVLDEFNRLSEGNRCYLKQESAEKLFYHPETKDALLERLPDDIAYVRYFQNLIKNAFQRTIAPNRFKKIMSDYENKYSYSYAHTKRYFIRFCPQWVDVQNVKYLKRAPEKRKTYLATIAEKIMFDNPDYDAMEDAVFGFAKEEGVPYYEIELNGMEYTDEIEW
nr:hypothetical protein [uncultured Ruminococcus sp.]